MSRMTKYHNSAYFEPLIEAYRIAYSEFMKNETDVDYIKCAKKYEDEINAEFVGC